MNEIERVPFWKCVLNTGVNGFVTHCMLVGFIDPARKADAPLSLSIIARNLEQVHPLLRIGKVIPVTAIQ